MRWIWIDRFITFEPGKRAAAIKNVSLAEEHLHDHWSAYPVMPASLMIEGTAQTAGILIGHAMNFEGKPVLGKITRAEFEDEVLPGDQLTYHVEIEHLSEQAAATNGTVLKNDEPIGRVDLMFPNIEQNMQGIRFPGQNFAGMFRRLIAPFVGDDDE